jgi:hypothetical protein
VLGYGALGALGSLLVVQVVPYGLALLNGGAEFNMSIERVVGFIIVVVGFAAAGALVALLLGSDATRAKEPIAYGLGWQGLIGGFLQGRRAESEADKAANGDDDGGGQDESE